MNSLDEFFGDALDRAAMPATQERRAAVAEVTVNGARRQRRARAAAQAVGTLVVCAAVIATTMFINHGAPPADTTPTPTQPAPSATPTASPEAATALDPRLAPAPAMTGDDWNNLAFSWDAELASVIGGGKDGYGWVVAIYLTPPGGSRLLAYWNSTTFVEAPTLLGFDAQTRSAIVSGMSPSGGVSALNLLTGAVTDMPLDLADPVSRVEPLGKISNGDSLFLAITVDSQSKYTDHVFRTFNNTAVPVTSGRFDVSPVWGDRLVVTTDEAFTFLDGDGTPPADVPAPPDCVFDFWNSDGTFVAACGVSTGDVTEYLQVNPDSGESTVLWSGQGGSTSSALPPTFGEIRAIDQVRSWSGVGIGFAPGYPAQPPILLENGEKVADLAEGFSQAPQAYGIIFGLQHPLGS